MKDQQIAIVGLACRFPGAPDKDTFWKNLQHGECAIRSLASEEIQASGESPHYYQDEAYVNQAAILSDVTCFDARFFGIGAQEVYSMDPQQRLLLEVGYHALEDAGYTQSASKCVTGVYACGGGVTTSYLYQNQPHFSRMDDGTASMVHLGNDKDFLATRLAFKLNLTGPAMTVQTACSSSMSALHTARSAILLDEVEMAVVAASAIRFPHYRGYHPQEHPILSSDGRCRPFSADASGTLFGSGVGAVVVKKLSAALRDHDQIYAVLHATAMSNDGANKVGYSASSVKGQTGAIAQALRSADVTGKQISYIECHGTATRIGDPLEIKALTQSVAREERPSPCLLGSVKSNVGHLEQAAGMVSLIKVALMLKHRKLVPTLYCDPENEKLNLSPSFALSRETCHWPADYEKESYQRYAGINCLGIGGSNIFAVLSDYLPLDRSAPTPSVEEKKSLFCLSAKNSGQLSQYLRNFSQWLDEHSHFPVSQVCKSTNLSRSQHKYRFSAMVDRHNIKDVLTQACANIAEYPISSRFYSRRIYLCQPRGEIDEQTLSQFYAHEQWSSVFTPICQEFLHITADRGLSMMLRRQLGFELGLLFQLKAWGIVFDELCGIGIGQLVTELFADSRDTWCEKINQISENISYSDINFTHDLPYAMKEKLVQCKRLFLLWNHCHRPEQQLQLDQSSVQDVLYTKILGPEQLLANIGKIYASGIDIDWRNWYENDTTEKISLPLYPFDKTDFWNIPE